VCAALKCFGAGKQGSGKNINQSNFTPTLSSLVSSSSIVVNF